MLKIREHIGDPRARLAIDVLRWHGLRISTLLTINHSNITRRRDGQVFLIFRTKRQRLVELPSREELCQELLATPEPLFPFTRHQFYRFLVRAAKEALGRHVTPHDLRRSFCTRVYGETLDLDLTRRLMSHASAGTTTKYLTPDVPKMARVLEKL